MLLPPPRQPQRYRIGLVCLGNICRSPMAEVVLSSALADHGLDDRVEVVSSGTGGWHIGEPMDRRAAAVLTAHGYDASRHRAQQLSPDWFDDCDVLLVMDSDNLADVLDLAGDDASARDGRIKRFRELDPLAEGDLDVPDPYYGGDDGFSRVLAIVTRTSRRIADGVAALLDD